MIPEKIKEYCLYAIMEGDLGGIGPEIDGGQAEVFRCYNQ